MSVHYILDGYNLIWSTPKLDHGTLDQQRQNLLQYISDHHLTGSSNNHLTVVFDGKPGRSRPVSKGARILFSYDKEADTIIKNLVDQMSNATRAVVVTNDKAIQKWVRGAKARVLTSQEFLAVKKVSGSSRASKSLPANHPELTKELAKLWNA